MATLQQAQELAGRKEKSQSKVFSISVSQFAFHLTAHAFHVATLTEDMMEFNFDIQGN